MKKIIIFLFVVLTGFSIFACANPIAETKYEITIVDSLGGKIIASDSEISSSKDVLITVEPDTGYELYSLMINDVEKSHLVEAGKFTLKLSDFEIESNEEKITIKSVFLAQEEIIKKLKNGTTIEIDGVEDEIWAEVIKFHVSNVYDDENGNFNEQNAWLKVLWTENGMYFFGRVYDKSVNAYDRYNIWFSEKYISAEIEGATPYSNNSQDGNWAICVNPNAQNLYYTGIDITAYWTVASKVLEDGYAVEIFMPLLSVGTLEAGMNVALDISVDYYSNGSTARETCVNWYGKGLYWEYITALKKMILVG